MQRVAKPRVTVPENPANEKGKKVQSGIDYVRGQFLPKVATNTAFPALNNPPPTTPTPNVPTYTDILDAVNALQNQEDIVLAGSTIDATLLRDDLYNVIFEPVTGMLALAAAYIAAQGGKDATTLASSGLNLTKTEIFPITVLSQPATPTLQPPTVKVNGTRTLVSGSLEAKTKKVPGAFTYTYTAVPVDANRQPIVGATPIVSLPTGKIKYKFASLTPGQQYMVTLIATGRREGVVSTVSGPAFAYCI